MHVSNAFLNGKQSFIDGCGPLEGTHIENQRRKRIEVSDRASVADLGALDAELFRLTVDALTSGALVGEGVVERAGAIQSDALDTSEFPVDIFDAAFAFGERCVLACCAGFFRKEQGAWEALSAKAMGVVERDGGVHGQATGTERGAISQASKGRFGRLSEGDSGDAALASGSFINVPCIRSSISGKMGGIRTEGSNDLAMEGAERRDIVLVERLGLCSQDHIARVRGRSRCNARTVAPKQFFLFLRFFVLW